MFASVTYVDLTYVVGALNIKASFRQKMIVYKKGGTSSDNNDNIWKQVTENDKEWKQMIMSDSEWQQVVQRMKTTEYASKNGWLPQNTETDTLFKGWMAAIRVIK